VPYGRIYDILASLEEKGLVRTVPEKTKKYVASDPEKLHTIIDSKIKSLMEIDTKVKELKKVYEENEKEPVAVVKGKGNFYKIAKEIKEAEKYEYNIKYNFELHHEFIRGANDKITNRIEHKNIGRIDKETEKAIKEWKTIHKEIKPIENEGVAMSIVDDEEVMIALIKSNTTMLIRDKAFAKIMKQLFIKYYMNTEMPEIK